MEKGVQAPWTRNSRGNQLSKYPRNEDLRSRPTNAGGYGPGARGDQGGTPDGEPHCVDWAERRTCRLRELGALLSEARKVFITEHER